MSRSRVRDYVVLALGLVATLLISWYALGDIPRGNWFFTGHYACSFCDVKSRIHDVATAAHGGVLYAADAHKQYFTYPPAALFLFWPLSWVSKWVAIYWWTVLTMLATAVSIAAAWKALTGEWSVRTLGRSLLAGAVAVVTIPVISICISQGQTASIIMAALILDALVIRHRGQGVLTGAAAAIKLYPALFIFWWLVKREWRPARNAAASALATTALAWWVWPGYSHRFFFYRLISGREVSHFHDKIHWRATSSSPYTVFFRPPFGQSTLSSVLGSIAIVVVTVGLVYAAWRIFRRGYPISAFVVGLMAATFAAPVVWDHYFAWAVLFIPVAIELGWKSRAGLAALLALVTTMIPWGLARDENFSNVGLTPTTMLIFVARNALLVTSVIFAVVATTAPLRGDNASAGELVE